MKQRTIDLMKRRTAVLAVVAVALALGLATLALHASSASAHGPSGNSEQPVTQADVYRALNDPNRSGLDPTLALRLAALGAKVVSADVTGVGRDSFGDYWAGGQYRPCCQTITVHAAGARPSATHRGTVEVIVAWSAQRTNNEAALTDQVSTITFRPVGSNWQPVPPLLLGP